MSIQAYINFSGNCGEALEFYKEVFKTEKPRVMRFGDAPAEEGYEIAEEMKNLIMHGALKIKDSTIMFSDVPPNMPLTVGNNISLVYNSSDVEEIKAIFGRLKDGGKVMMELQETFWSKSYGFVIDKFGIGWQLSYESGGHSK